MSEMNSSLYEVLKQAQDTYIDMCTGGRMDAEKYATLRNRLLSERALRSQLPDFVQSCRDLSQFWTLAKNRDPTYQGRREWLWSEFGPLLDRLEYEAAQIEPINPDTLKDLEIDHVVALWEKAQSRSVEDPEGAITAARSLLESVCKLLLEELEVSFENKWDLQRLYRETAARLNLSPSKEKEEEVRRILGGGTTMVDGIAMFRNAYSDSHGSGRRHVKPAPRHARLVVSLSGAMACFLVETWQARQSRSANG